MRANTVPTNHDEPEASELIRQGRYFDQARQWYSALYIGPISERSFFLVLGLLAVLVGLCGFAALVGLTPLTDRPALVIRNDRLDETMPSLIRLRESGQDINDALRLYMVKQYVFSRESYIAASYAKDVRFVAAHSDPGIAATYIAAVGPENPRNPAALLGAYGTRTVQISNVSLSKVDGRNRAVVRFSTELGGSAPAGKSQWTATIDFNYSDAVVTEATDPETNQKTATLQQPEFQVVSYALTQAP